jgi:hypothetical protein
MARQTNSSFCNLFQRNEEVYRLLRWHRGINFDYRFRSSVAAMGLEKIHFFWYVKRISGLALLGYLGGAAVYIVQYGMLH